MRICEMSCCECEDCTIEKDFILLPKFSLLMHAVTLKSSIDQPTNQMERIIPTFNFVEMDFFQELVFVEHLLTHGKSSDAVVTEEPKKRFVGRRNINEERRSRRESLKLHLNQRSSYLSEAQNTFLKSILDEGDDHHITLADERLSDDNLFYEPIKEENSRNNAGRRLGSEKRRSSLAMRLSNNTTHTAMMLKAFARQKWKNAGNKIMVMNKLMGKRRVKSIFSKYNDDVVEDLPEADTVDFKACMRKASALSRGETVMDDMEHKSDDEKTDEQDCSDDDFKACIRTALALSREEAFMDDTEYKADDEKTDGRDSDDVEIKPDIRRIKSDGQAYEPWAKLDEKFDGIHFDFHIIGTSADDSASPHVLSPPLMHSLQDHLPFCKRSESFWLKYSLVRDGASASCLLNKLRGTKYAVMAMETVDGEVFGAFTAQPWHFDSNPYGTGESFLWKMKNCRGSISDSVAEQAKKESEIEVFRYSYENKSIQMCHSYPTTKIAIGGGCASFPREVQGGISVSPHEWGYGLCFEDDFLIEGTTSPCITFNSPALSEKHKNGSNFELINLEMWALTPCLCEKEAEMMECNRLFLQRNMTYRV
jgi:hypothetical protein